MSETTKNVIQTTIKSEATTATIAITIVKDSINKNNNQITQEIQYKKQQTFQVEM